MSENKNGDGWRGFGKFLAVSSIVPIIIGFNKIFSYNSGEYYTSSFNAYNYIINANYATSYFVLAGILILSAIGCGILWYLAMIRNSVDDNNITSTNTENSDCINSIENTENIDSTNATEHSDNNI